MKVLYKPQKESVSLVRFLIKSPNLFEVQKVLKKDNTFKAFIVERVQEIIKEEISVVVSNPKLSMASSQISLNIIERFFILTIDNK